MQEAESNFPAKLDAQSGSKQLAQPSDLEPFFSYLNGERGHELAARLITVIEGIKQATLDKSASHALIEKYLQAGVILAVVIATSFLVYYGKFEASVGVLFGTLVGYAFGKKQ